MTKTSTSETRLSKIAVSKEMTLKEKGQESVIIPFDFQDAEGKVFRNIVAIPMVASLAMYFGMPLVDGSMDAMQNSDVAYLFGVGMPAAFAGMVMSLVKLDKYILHHYFGKQVDKQAIAKIRRIRKNLVKGETKYISSLEIFGETELEAAAKERGMTVGLSITRKRVSMEWRLNPSSEKNWDEALKAVSDVYQLTLATPLKFESKGFKMANCRCIYSA